MSVIRSDVIKDKPVCVRSTSVLIRATNQLSEFVGFRNFDYLDAPKDRGRGRHVRLANEDWEDMGKPDEITVTIEVGDKLNAGDTLNADL